MRNPWAWGGEPEILMLARALRTPIEVFVVVEGENASAREGGELRSIGRYGEDEEEEEDGDEEEEEEEDQDEEEEEEKEVVVVVGVQSGAVILG